MLDHDFREFIACCAAREVRFLVVGRYALAAHGHPRFTKDLDVWVAMDADNRSRLVEALYDFGFGSTGLTASDFAEAGTVVQLGYPPKRIDLLTSVTGIDFESCYPNRLLVDIDGIEVPFVDLAALLVNKRAVGRPQDLADVAALEAD